MISENFARDSFILLAKPKKLNKYNMIKPIYLVGKTQKAQPIHYAQTYLPCWRNPRAQQTHQKPIATWRNHKPIATWHY